MFKVALYSLLLLLGLGLSQALPLLGPATHHAVAEGVALLTMVGLAFIMIHVGLEFELDKRHARSLGWDYAVAATAAAFPWVLASLYFVFVLAPPGAWANGQVWKEALLQGRFASPTSAGVLFSMLAAAGLGATWVFRKARVLAIFDDLDTILLMVPLQVMMVGLRWQLAALVAVVVLLLGVGWRFLGAWRIPYRWPWVLGYAVVLALLSEGVMVASERLEPGSPVHLEVLLPAFVLGCVMRRPRHGLHEQDAHVGQEPGPDARKEQRVATIVAACFMALVGLSMPPVRGMLPAAVSGAQEAVAGLPSAGTLALHVLAVTVLINLGKLVPALCYRREATGRERLALAVALFPRGEVGAGVLVLSLAYGIDGASAVVAALSLALNLLLTGGFILVVRRLIRDAHVGAVVHAGAARRRGASPAQGHEGTRSADRPPARRPREKGAAWARAAEDTGVGHGP